jgi:Protein of unknown function (DUF2530)
MNARRIVAVGTALFFAAFLVLLAFHHWLDTHHHRDWLWTCLAGGILGIMGSTIMLRHRRQGRTI